MTHAQPPAPAANTDPSERLHVLYAADTASGVLPPPLSQRYGGDLALPAACFYGNFVSSLDGVVALGPEYPSSGSAISGREPADRFVMGLLRAVADAVLIGAGTLRATPNHDWTAEHVSPHSAALVAAMRSEAGQQPRPLLVVVSGSGHLPATHPALSHPALVVTTPTGEARLEGRLPKTAQTVVPAGHGGAVTMDFVRDVLRQHGCRRVLTEGGPHLLGQLIDAGLLDELFLTVAPRLAGRGSTPRAGFISDLELLPGRHVACELMEVRRHGSFLFLRYRLSETAREDAHDRT